MIDPGVLNELTGYVRTLAEHLARLAENHHELARKVASLEEQLETLAGRAQGRRLQFDRDTTAAIVSGYQSGVSILALAKANGVDRDVIRRVLTEQGVTLRSGGRKASQS